MNIDIWSDLELSYFRNARAKCGNSLHPDEVAMRLIHSGEDSLSNKTRQCRALASTDPEAYRKFKETALPAVTFSGIFETRDKSVPLSDRWRSHSGLVILDFDGVMEFKHVEKDSRVLTGDW